MKIRYYQLLLILLFMSTGCTHPKVNFEPEMVFVEGGEFRMGCTEEQIPECISDEKPVVRIRLDDYWIGRFEVTNSQYAEFLSHKGNQVEGNENWYEIDKYSLIYEREDGSFEPCIGFENYPITNVSWYGSNAYTGWLSERTKRNYRLPTEAEWEYASRGGQKSRGFVFSGSDSPEEIAWFSDYAADSKTGWEFKMDKGTHPVGQRSPNELGLYDMSGNAAEWCFDLYENFYEGGKNPTGPKYGSLRVLRGGSWDNTASDCRVSARNYAQHVSRFSVSKGFRVVRDNRDEYSS